MPTGFCDDRAPVRVADDDRGVYRIKSPAESCCVSDKATLDLVGVSFPTGRRGYGAALDTGALLQQICRPLPPPRSVPHQRTVYKNQLHVMLFSPNQR